MSATVETQARKWLDLRISGDMNDEQRICFQNWMEQSEAHKLAYTQLARLWGDLSWSEALNADALAPSPREGVRRRSLGAFVSGPRAALLSGTLAACAGLAIFLSGQQMQGSSELVMASSAAPATIYETGIAEVRQVILADGSEVTLAGKSKLSVSFAEGRRQAKLLAGDGYFKISHDANRPFSVDAGHVVTRVLGTQFEINTRPAHVEVSVVEGAVEVSPVSGEQKANLTVGQRASVDRNGQIITSQFSPAQAASWRQQRLIFVNTPLQELVDEVNQYYPQGVYLGSTDIYEAEVTTSFRIDQIETAMSGIALGLDLDLIRTSADELVLRARSGQK
ncbi:FecR family protein [Hyphomonas pacifica]|uniref:FecR protein domain-containing protein n=1 Tax=Hyphomonas pacifica TaxID=1280941 RepID=A0A062U194_9PROT|nr:FecR domain-containing protein [Hyphomonas pacifica]KCZ49043.1 hypothetical protein HY2_15500 [Hyphomonas pacifica]RAN31886.1 hypothetical protein HY3_16210 [Hyphomonas pacifica]RAN34006.1 hypothetical protein HY11_15965 [Hyphomonas pacifica]